MSSSFTEEQKQSSLNVLEEGAWESELGERFRVCRKDKGMTEKSVSYKVGTSNFPYSLDSEGEQLSESSIKTPENKIRKKQYLGKVPTIFGCNKAEVADISILNIWW